MAAPIVQNGIARPVEVAASLAGLIISAPLLALAAAAIAATSRGPILFRQKRVGRGGRTFVLVKLRTMRLENRGPQVTAGGDERVTRVGRFLRRTKLDELPELWNVIEGSMSLVGPRPEVPRYVDLNNPAWRLVLEARPGITDPMTLRLCNEEALLAEIEGDHEHFYLRTLQPLKLRGYLQYLQRRNWWTDVKVLCESCLAVVLRGRKPVPTVEEIFHLVSGSAGDARDVQPREQT